MLPPWIHSSTFKPFRILRFPENMLTSWTILEFCPNWINLLTWISPLFLVKVFASIACELTHFTLVQSCFVILFPWTFPRQLSFLCPLGLCKACPSGHLHSRMIMTPPTLATCESMSWRSGVCPMISDHWSRNRYKMSSPSTIALASTLVTCKPCLSFHLAKTKEKHDQLHPFPTVCPTYQ